jgi:hypothetical protein
MEAARFTVVVVLPTPPFWFAIARIRFTAAFLSHDPVDTLIFEEKICARIG